MNFDADTSKVQQPSFSCSQPPKLKPDPQLGEHAVNEAICEVDEETATGANNEVMHVVRDAGH